MIPIELLRRYPFFGHLDERQLKSLATIAEEIILEAEEVVLEEDQPARALFFLLSGCIDLYYTVQSSPIPEEHKTALICQINPGEPFGISALIEPYIYTSTGQSRGISRILRIEAGKLRRLLEGDPRMETRLLRQVSKAAIERLHATRIQLAAAYV